MRGRRRLYSAFLLSTALLLLLSWVNKQRLLPSSQVRCLSSRTVAIVLHTMCKMHAVVCLAVCAMTGLEKLRVLDDGHRYPKWQHTSSVNCILASCSDRWYANIA